MSKTICEFREDYANFTIGEKARWPFLNKIAWVCSARSEEKNRININHILIDENYIVATDGRKLHMIVNYGYYLIMKQGLWEVLKHTKTELTIKYAEKQGSFPDYEKLLDKFKSCNGTSYFINNYRKDQKDLSLSSFVFDLFTEYETPFNVELISGSLIHGEQLQYQVDKEIKCLAIADNDLTSMALIMGYRRQNG